MAEALIVVATAQEAVRLKHLGARVVVSGVGPVAAALCAQHAIWERRPPLVISAGIGGAFEGSGLRVGGAAVASRVVHADLGAWDGERFLSLAELGLDETPRGGFPTWEGSGSVELPCGPFVTVSSVTGSAAGARELLRRVPGALVEGMEGAGVARAAWAAGVPMTELRGVSNMVGPREREKWRVPEALSALEAGLKALLRTL